MSPKENTQSILKKGITTATGGRTFLNRTYTPRIYLATSLIGAHDIQTNFNSHDGHDYTIFEINTSKIEGPFFDDELFLHGIYTESNVPKESITKTIDPDSLIFRDEDLEDMYNHPWMEYDAPEPLLRESITLKRFNKF